MVAVKEQQIDLQQLNNKSKTSIWGLLLFIVASCMEDLKKYFESHRAYVDDRLANQIAGTLPWYRTKALAFQYGFDLLTDSSKYKNGIAKPEEITASKVIKYATANDGETKGSVVIKVATEKNGQLSTIEEEQEKSLKKYFEEIKFAGDDVVIINHLADKLFLNLKIYIDPLVLNSGGVSIRNGNKPVEAALLQFMKELPFNGELILQSLVDKLQLVEGVKIAHIVEAKSSELDPQKDEHGTAQLIEVKKIPASGYFEIETFKDVDYVV
ncbi:nucleotidyltransferase [Tenacibaculum maritimum]|nr:nucleotidyltransferase [Tenacibaculum maritimum]MDB0602647.1 nucleotidyltransferase [Tenacibaculum maritimum]MDB0611242.1 nucleotidyltransferase [Tenacibaculum maritimum]